MRPGLEQALDLLGDQAPLAGPGRVAACGREHRDESERAVPLPRDRLDLLQGIEIPRLARAEEQRDRPGDAGRQGFLQDREDRREAASARDEDQRRAARSQPEVSGWTVDADLSADEVLVVHLRREEAAGHLPHQEMELPVVARRGGERVAPDHPLQPLDAEVRELSRLVRQRLVELHAEARDVVRDLPLRDHAAGHAALRGPRREVDRDLDVRPRDALAGQDVSLVDLVGRQEVTGLRELLDHAGGEPTLARATAPYPAAAGKLDALAQGRLQDGLARFDGDRLVVDLRGDESLPGSHRSPRLERPPSVP